MDGVSCSGKLAEGAGIITAPQCAHCGFEHLPSWPIAGTQTLLELSLFFEGKELDSVELDLTGFCGDLNVFWFVLAGLANGAVVWVCVIALMLVLA
ncbi:unnamed protein product [Ambrosiozyma monospora]|uniref:Unnamed protein product n=1 Tax=Ambrosiozyma monospora TaxID=43982 RepID=A0ACB5UCJ2_AMBMO|nr:unnamed protein product [Ambrosiozyma monospora]